MSSNRRRANQESRLPAESPSISTLVVSLPSAPRLPPLRGRGGGGAAAAARPGETGGAAAPGPIPRRADGKPNLEGVWNGGRPLAHRDSRGAHLGGFGIRGGKSLIIDPATASFRTSRGRWSNGTAGGRMSMPTRIPLAIASIYDIGRLHSFAQDHLSRRRQRHHQRQPADRPHHRA